VGRLFDAVASLLGLCDRNTFEGEAAMLLESKCGTGTPSRLESYARLTGSGNIPTRALLSQIRAALVKGVAIPDIIRNFMFTLARLVLEKADAGGFRKIAFSGGVFQNACLADMLRETGNGKYELYFHRELSSNDENIAYGQLMYYLYCQSHEIPE
jgi:hydrogenase maturation protein HypF